MPASARAMATRCFCPPERSRGRKLPAVGQADGVEHALGLARAPRRPSALHVERVLDVLERGQRGEQVELLEDEADRLPADRRQAAGPAGSTLFAVHDDRCPSVGVRMQPRIESSVVLPEPDGPFERDDLAAARRRARRRLRTSTRLRASSRTSLVMVACFEDRSWCSPSEDQRRIDRRHLAERDHRGAQAHERRAGEDDRGERAA